MSDGYISTLQFSIPLLLHYGCHPAFEESESTELAEVSLEVASFLPGDSRPGRRSRMFDDDPLAAFAFVPPPFRPLKETTNE
jgi:hypothetical protein